MTSKHTIPLNPPKQSGVITAEGLARSIRIKSAELNLSKLEAAEQIGMTFNQFYPYTVGKAKRIEFAHLSLISAWLEK